MRLDRPDPVLVRLERARMVTAVCAMAAAAASVTAAAYIAFAWAISPCEGDLAALQQSCSGPAVAIILARMLLHCVSIGACVGGAVIATQALRAMRN